MMTQVGEVASKGRALLLSGEAKAAPVKLGELFDENFGLRRTLFGDAALGAENVAMVQAAKVGVLERV